MPLTHHASRRVVLALAVATVAALCAYATAWLRPPPDGPRTLMIRPPVPSSPAAAIAALPSPSPAVPARSPSRSPSPSHRPAPAARTRKPSRSTAPPAVTAAYATRASWDRGFLGEIILHNTGTTPQSWNVTLQFPDDAGVRIGPVWNATAERGADRTVLRGRPLAPGATLTVGFEASKRTHGPVPLSCTVNGSPCLMR